MEPGDIYKPPPVGNIPRRGNPHANPPVDPYAPPPPVRLNMDNRGSATPSPGPYPPYPPSSNQHENPFQHPSEGGGGGDWGAPPPVPPPPQPYAELGRTDSNVSYNTPYGLQDNRLTSPPPLFPSHSSTPAPGFSASQPGYSHPLDDDYNDAQPLLSHALPHPSFNIQPMPTPPAAPYDPPMDAAGGRVRFDNPYDEGPGEQSHLHYGAPPARVLRRNRTQKRVQ